MVKDIKAFNLAQAVDKQLSAILTLLNYNAKKNRNTIGDSPHAYPAEFPYTWYTAPKIFQGEIRWQQQKKLNGNKSWPSLVWR